MPIDRCKHSTGRLPQVFHLIQYSRSQMDSPKPKKWNPDELEGEGKKKQCLTYDKRDTRVVAQNRIMLSTHSFTNGI